MELLAYFNFFCFSIAFSLLIWFFVGPWADFCTNFTRQRLFRLRDRLFNLAIAGDIRFVDVNYIRLRAAINANIRYAHQVSLIGLILFLVTGPKDDGINDLDRMQKELAHSAKSYAARREIRLVCRKMQMEMGLLLLMRSPVLWVIFVCFIIACAVVELAKFILAMPASKVKRTVKQVLGSSQQIGPHRSAVRVGLSWAHATVIACFIFLGHAVEASADASEKRIVVEA